MTDADRLSILTRYVDGGITVEHAADLLGPGVSVSEVVLEASARLGRLPVRDDAFTRQEYQRALRLLGLDEGKATG